LSAEPVSACFERSVRFDLIVNATIVCGGKKGFFGLLDEEPED
jgi:hypothetical protein